MTTVAAVMMAKRRGKKGRIGINITVMITAAATKRRGRNNSKNPKDMFEL
jgi:hypothetical protein